MKLLYRMLIVFFTLILVILTVTSFISFKATETAVIDSSLSSMKSELFQTSLQMQNLHEKAKSDIILALHYPVFKEYFSLPETRAGNKLNAEGVIQFTKDQLELKAKIDDWTLFVQSRFPVEETCVIDKTGQEHSRITLKKIAPTDDFSSTENAAPFFAHTMDLSDGEVNIEYPYISADVEKWVFAYSSPIVLDDGSKPAFYHFEMPISFFQDKGKGASGRIVVLDPSNIVVVDSAREISITLKPGDSVETAQISSYLPSPEYISKSTEYNDILAQMRLGKSGEGKFTDNGVTYYVVYDALPTFGWSISEIKSYDQLLQGKSSLVQLKKTIFIIVAISLLITILLVFFVSSMITRPINQLRLAADNITSGNFETILPDAKSKDEISSLTASFEMVMVAFKTLRGKK